MNQEITNNPFNPLINKKIFDEIKISLNKMYNLDFSEKEWFEKIIIQKLDESKLVNIDARNNHDP